MRNRQVKRIVRAPFYIWLRKHVCPDCGVPLRRVRASCEVPSRPLGERESGFQTTDAYRIDNTEYVWTEFRCLMCGEHFTVEKIRRTEQKKRAERCAQ